MKKYNWATLGCGVIANELAVAMEKKGKKLYSAADIYSAAVCAIYAANTEAETVGREG